VSSVGSPIYVDDVASKYIHEHNFGHFVRVLVDIDLTNDLKYKILVERKCFAFCVDLEYEATPDFGSFCKNIGHNVDKCINVKPDEGVKSDRNGNTRRKQGKKPLK